MRCTRLLGALLISLPLASALIGYGIDMYKPSCAFACRAAIASAPLSCSDVGDSHGMSHHGSGMTSPECRASDTSFLTTLAWCIKSTCASYNIDTWKLEKYWREKTTGDMAVAAKWTYGEATQQVVEIPKEELGEDTTLNMTVLVPHDSWLVQKLTMEYFEGAETTHSRYGIVILVVGFSIPIIFTLFGYLPYTSTLLSKIKPYVVYPAVIGKYHIEALPYLLGNAPTMGQTLYIFGFSALNIILAAAGYKSTQPNTYFDDQWQEIMGYVSARTGVLAFALSPLVILFAGRNNLLLWITNWSHATFILLHRWVARILTLQIIIHSILELMLYIRKGTYKEELVSPYWIWGAVATVASCIMVVISSLYFRRLSYEVFLVLHILLAVFVLAGSWYHVELLFTRKWGYEFWLYAACGVWFFDRVLRLLRITKVGVRRSTVTKVSSEIMRVDIPGVRWDALPGRHVYAYFPTLNALMPWQNHPFSIVPSSYLLPLTGSISGAQSPSRDSSDKDVEKSDHITKVSEIRRRDSTTAGVTLFIKKSTGLTKFLKTHDTMLTLLEGPYTNNSPSAVLKCDRLVLIGGGIGVTALLPFIRAHSNVSLFWSMKASAEPMVSELSPLLDSLAEKKIAVGQRLDIQGLLEQEARVGWRKIGVVACGPGGFCDEVRSVVVRLGRTSEVEWELEIDAFSW
ncbi:ferric reductase like transmembrane component-domain-containing protein [Amylocarpus encephaloides]|uniref:Ferric reductase like transmembrane component-domain-containing protein n=1 Tax=Amylocarpus encephaloides TaxID=45428 RepID=A0A9P7YJZ8_9HELO|nr:ferric reductase like transmembrane component-domain-containing protein [Amylocarpus encephaloides]